MKASACLPSQLSRVFTVVVALAVLCGCETREGVVFMPTSVEVTWNQLWTDAAALDTNGFRLAVQDPTRGVFPASIAVARIAATPDETHDHADLVLDMKPEVDFLSWNSAFDELRSISEVFPLNIMAMNGADVRSQSLVTAALALRSRLCLIYTEIQPNQYESELRGVLVDVPDRRLLASIRWRSFVPDPIPSDEHYPADMTEEEFAEQETLDPRLQSVSHFQSAMNDCLLALMANDTPAERISPKGWVPDRPLEPAIWPPLDGRRRSDWYHDDE